jgi:hypothetical protein
VGREVRKGQNESWFRELNERLERLALMTVVLDEPFEIVCECDREECVERLRVGLAEYEAVRACATDFIIAPGHHDPFVEKIASHTDEYDVVTKTGEAALVATEDDPRG